VREPVHAREGEAVKGQKLNATEVKCLNLLAEAYQFPEHCILFFQYFGDYAGLTLTQTRRAVRSLARKGLAEHSRCFDCDDGKVMGSGYMATAAGIALAKTLEK
jgi:hypothetical protein